MKTAIIYLVKNDQKHINNLHESLERLQSYWKLPNRPAVILFHEDVQGYIWAELDRKIGNIFHAKVKFEIPEWIDQSRVPENYFGSVGYRHMCRFFAGSFLQHSTLDGLDYVWRLDTDSFLTRPLPYNPFQKLADEQAAYGYLTSFQDIPEVTVGLWEATQRFVDDMAEWMVDRTLNDMALDNHFVTESARKDLKAKTVKDILSGVTWDRHLYYTNFEILDLNWFRAPKYGYLDFFDWIDHEGGIYYKRWGDHIIRHLGLQLFVGKAHQFKDIGYKHQFFEC